MRQISANDLTLSRSLQWFAGQALRRGVGCSVMVLRPSAHGTRHSLRASGGEARGEEAGGEGQGEARDHVWNGRHHRVFVRV